MARHLVIDGNAFYEVDDECIKNTQMRQEKEEKDGKSKAAESSQKELRMEKKNKKKVSD